MDNLSKSMIKLYICDNKLRSCAQFAPPNLHHLQRWSKLAPGCRFAPGCIFIKHHLHDQNTPHVQIYTPGVYLHRGVYCAYERGLRVFKILKFELKTLKNESRKFTIFQTNQYGKQNSNLSNVFHLVTSINET